MIIIVISTHPPHSLTNNYLETVTGAFTYSYGYLDDVWKVFGACLEHVWNMSGECLECVRKYSLIITVFWLVVVTPLSGGQVGPS